MSRDRIMDQFIQIQLIDTPRLISMTEEEYDKGRLGMLSRLMGLDVSDEKVSQKLAELRKKYPQGNGDVLAPEVDALIAECFERRARENSNS